MLQGPSKKKKGGLIKYAEGSKCTADSKLRFIYLLTLLCVVRAVITAAFSIWPWFLSVDRTRGVGHDDVP